MPLFAVALAAALFAPGPLEDLGRAFEAAAKAASPAVISIVVERDPLAAEKTSRPTVPAPPGAPGTAERPPYAVRPPSPVSGVVIDPRGLVLTSAFNLEGGRSFTIVFPDGTRAAASRLGSDEECDVVLLKLVEPPKCPLPALALETRPPPPPGAFVIVVGRGPGGSLTVNAGIASGLRFGGAALQTDAATNWSNYGGAAVDLEGRLVGVVIRPSARPGVNSGVGFVAPVSRVLAVFEDLERGLVRKAPPRPFLGVQFGRELEAPPGVEVSRVLPGTAAAAAGLEAGDVIRSIDDVPALDAGTVSETIRARRPGASVRVEVERAAHRMVFEVRLGERPAEER